MAFTKITNAGFGLTTGTLVGVAASFSSTVSVGGTLTYEDVTNVDSVGLITARSGISITGGDLTVPDAIIHDGDTNTRIRFPAADTFSVETGGSEALRVDSGQRLLVGTTSDTAPGGFNAKIQTASTTFDGSISLRRDSDNTGAQSLVFGKSRGSLNGNTVVQSGDTLGTIDFYGADGTDLNTAGAQILAAVDAAPGSNDMPGRLVFSTTADGASSVTERLRIDSSGRLLISTTSSTSNIAGYGNGGIQLNSTTTAQACVNIIHRSNSNNTNNKY